MRWNWRSAARMTMLMAAALILGAILVVAMMIGAAAGGPWGSIAAIGMVLLFIAAGLGGLT